MIKTIGVIDYNCGNIQSIVNAINFLGYECKLITCAAELGKVEKIILPGVGAFDHAVNALHENQLFYAIQEWAKNTNNVLLGICLGMQLLCRQSEESSTNKRGLALIDADVISLSNFSTVDDKVPHIGWNEVHIQNSKIFQNIPNEMDFYFVHSYAVIVNKTKNSLAVTQFASQKFDSMITNNINIFGMQFHPEKSHNNGLNLLKKFIEYAKN